MITRRCIGRRFFLTPNDKRIQDHILWCLAVYAERYGMLIHSFCFLSNHYHLVVTDTLGVYPSFTQAFNSAVARGVNAIRGRTGTFWDEGRTHTAMLLSDEDMVREIAYTLSNPTSAGLVKWGHRWPGLTSYRMDFGLRKVLKRPDFFFAEGSKEDGKNKTSVLFQLSMPILKEEKSPTEFRETILLETRQRELQKQKTQHSTGQRFCGERRIAHQSWWRAPRNREDRFGVVKRVSSSCKWSRIAKLQRNAQFEEEYAEAMSLRERGEDPEFPCGVWQLRVFHHVRVAGSP